MPRPGARPLTPVLACLRRLRHAATAADLSVKAVVLAIPAWLDPDCDLAASVVDDRWDGLELRGILTEHAVEPLQIDTAVRLAALAHARRGQASAGGTYVGLSLGAQVGCAIVADGRLVRGRHHAAGHIAAALRLDVAAARARLDRGDALAGPPLDNLLDELASVIRALVGVADPGAVILDGSVGSGARTASRSAARTAVHPLEPGA